MWQRVFKNLEEAKVYFADEFQETGYVPTLVHISEELYICCAILRDRHGDLIDCTKSFIIKG